jgi:hypothetical protein
MFQILLLYLFQILFTLIESATTRRMLHLAAIRADGRASKILSALQGRQASIVTELY